MPAKANEDLNPQAPVWTNYRRVSRILSKSEGVASVSTWDGHFGSDFLDSQVRGTSSLAVVHTCADFSSEEIRGSFQDSMIVVETISRTMSLTEERPYDVWFILQPHLE